MDRFSPTISTAIEGSNTLQADVVCSRIAIDLMPHLRFRCGRHYNEMEAISTAISVAAIKLSAFARPLPAIDNAVP